MRYLALVTDYDGTLSSDDKVSEQTVRALERLRVTGRRAILVTGRRLDDLLVVCPCASLFDLIVAENNLISARINLADAKIRLDSVTAALGVTEK